MNNNANKGTTPSTSITDTVKGYMNTAAKMGSQVLEQGKQAVAQAQAQVQHAVDNVTEVAVDDHNEQQNQKFKANHQPGNAFQDLQQFDRDANAQAQAQAQAAKAKQAAGGNTQAKV